MMPNGLANRPLCQHWVHRYNLQTKIIEPDVAFYYPVRSGLTILLHLKFIVRLALRTVVGLPCEDIRKMRQEKHSLAEEGLARDVKEASF